MLTLGRSVPGTGRRDAIITTSLDGRILFWSPGARALLGYREREVVGRHVQRILPEKHRNLDIQNVADVANGSTVRNIMMKYLCEDGSTLRCLVTMVPIKDGSGKIVATLRIVLDVSSSLDARRALQKSMAQIDEIASDASLRATPSPQASRAARYYRRERMVTLQEYLRVVESELDQLQILMNGIRGKAAGLDEILSAATEEPQSLQASEG